VVDVPTHLAEALRDRYLLERELGRGGMATVYLARDLKHDRPVALKVLHPGLAASIGPERFQREIRFAAQLQHPHILPLFDSGQVDGHLYYVMPYIEGESLRDRLAREGELPVQEALRLLSEITDALAYAHAHGVVHRDIKPDNIMLSGRHALIADLGVAKAISEAAPPGEALTTAGLALGTPRYMAPEQVTADPHLDHRVDIYALGVMAYEMLAAAPPFTGATPQAIFAAHVTQEPTALDLLRPGISPQLSQVIAMCLAKRPADRWQSAVELLAQLETLATPREATAARSPAPDTRRARPMAWWGIGAALLAAAVLAAWLLLRRPEEAMMHVGARRPLTVDPGLEIDPAVSPDGRLVAYAAGSLADCRIYVRQVEGGTPIAIAKDVAGAQRFPFWSPDGKRILFRSARGIEVVLALGGPSQLLVPTADAAVLLPGGWSPDGRQFAFARADSLYLAPLSGGPPSLLAHGGDMHSFAWSADGRWMAAVRGNRQSVDSDVPFFFGNLGQSAIWLFPTETGDGAGGEAIRITDDRSFHASPVWVQRGRELVLAFLSNAEGGLDVYRLRISHSGRPDGAPVRVTTGLNAQAMSLAGDGRRLVYELFTERSNVWSLPVPSGPAIGISQAQAVTTGQQIVETFAFSPEGRWLAFDSDRNGTSQMFRQPLAGGEPQQLTTDSGAHFWPAWSPDGREIAYHAFRSGGRKLFVMSADGGQPVAVPAGDGDDRSAEWSNDGRGLYYLHDFDTPSPEVRFIARNQQGQWGAPRTIARIDALPVAVSPDGRLLAFSTTKGLMLTDPAGDSARILLPVSYRAPTLRSTYLSWSPDSRTLYYLALDSAAHASIWSIDRQGGAPRPVVHFDDPSREWHRYGFAVFRGRFYLTLGDRQSDLWVAEVDAGG
jgi:Tol biopolymer transport system component